MKAEELMIGDWVRIDEPDKYAGATGQIQSLMYHEEGDAAYFHVFIQGKFGYVLRDVCSDDIRPIPLTAEILEKNGFSKTGAYIFEDDYEHQILIYLKDENYTGGAYTYIDAHCGCLDISEMPVDYVHELQHALKLCGIEKEIIL